MRVTALSFVRLADLEPVLAEELSCWKHQLHWDYAPAIELIKRHIQLRALPGYALLGRLGSPVGYAYSLVAHRVGYIGNVFVRQLEASEEAYRCLIESLLDDLLRNSQVRRIEGQVFPFNFEIGPILQKEGLQLIPRHYLVRTPSGPENEPPRLPTGYRLESWDPSFLSEAANVIYRSYLGSGDLNLCADYQSFRGCRRFLSNLISGPGCGQFSPERSLLLQNQQRELVAVLLISSISSDTGMIPQISVLPEHQSRGLGSFLLKLFLNQSEGLERVALAVSKTNVRALQLYESLGFRPARDFVAVVFERSN